jgi:DNA-directed RNA polymerase specialized sigma24 family protein
VKVQRDEVGEKIEPTTAGHRFAAELVRELPYLVRLATRLVHDPDQAEDCAQETIVSAWRRQDQLRDPAAVSAWLRRSLVNRIIDRSRAHHEELDIDAVEADWRDGHGIGVRHSGVMTFGPVTSQ